MPRHRGTERSKVGRGPITQFFSLGSKKRGFPPLYDLGNKDNNWCLVSNELGLWDLLPEGEWISEQAHWPQATETLFQVTNISNSPQKVKQLKQKCVSWCVISLCILNHVRFVYSVDLFDENEFFFLYTMWSTVCRWNCPVSNSYHLNRFPFTWMFTLSFKY